MLLFKCDFWVFSEVSSTIEPLKRAVSSRARQSMCVLLHTCGCCCGREGPRGVGSEHKVLAAEAGASFTMWVLTPPYQKPNPNS